MRRVASRRGMLRGQLFDGRKGREGSQVWGPAEWQSWAVNGVAHKPRTCAALTSPANQRLPSDPAVAKGPLASYTFQTSRIGARGAHLRHFALDLGLY